MSPLNHLAIWLSFACFIKYLQANLYEPTWQSLDTRPLPSWFDEAKIGVSVHVGVFSVPSFGGEHFALELYKNKTDYVEFMKKNYPPGFTYEDFGPQFTAEFYNPKQWAELFAMSGAKYLVFNSKEVDGYATWPSNHSINWNVKDVGPHRDLLGEMVDALRKYTDLKFGIYYYLAEVLNPLFQEDKASGFKSNKYVEFKIMPELKEVVEKYQPEFIITNDDFLGDSKYWRAEEYLAWLYNHSPVKETVLVNDNWGTDTRGKHGDVTFNLDNKSRKWYSWYGIDKKPNGYKRNANLEDYHTTQEIIALIIDVVSRGGNLIIGIGATKEGTIIPLFQETLKEMGAWLKVNGEAIYGTKPWTHANEENKLTYYTTKDKSVFALSLGWPKGNKLSLKFATDLFLKSSTKAILLGANGEYLQWEIQNGIITLTFPDKATVKSNWAYVVKIQT